MVAKGNHENDFREQNPHLFIYPEFTKLYEDNKKDIASRICWAIALYEDTAKDNPFARMDSETRLSEIKTVFYPKFKLEDYEAQRKIYNKFNKEKEEILYDIQVRKYDELTLYLNKLNVETKTELDTYLNIMDKMSKITSALDNAKKLLTEKESKTRLHGNSQLSGREKGRK